MKKTLLLMTLGAFSLMPAVAQEEDVTEYIVNAGFDEDLTWNVDGSKKGEKVRETTLSDRSIAYVTEDGSLYATVNPSTPKSRGDGRTFEATNGFVGQIKGWEWVTPRTNDGCEWVYFGTFPYDLEEQAIPIADDGAGYITVPERPEDFDGGTGYLYLRAGWNGTFSYKQEVRLPCAVYRLEYWTININPNTSGSATDLTKITCRRDVFQEEGGEALNSTEWTHHEFEFTPVDKFTMEFGIKVSNNNSNTTPWMVIDGIKLYKIGEADPAEVLRSDIYFYLDEQLSTLPDSLIGVNGDEFIGLMDQAEALSDEYLYEGDDLEQLEESMNKLKDLFEQMLEARQTALRVEALYLKAQNILDVTNYPGKAALSTKTENIYDLLYGEDGTMEALAAAEIELRQAINDYYFSQPASMNEPANYSFLVPTPWFCAEGREPAGNSAAEVADAALVDADKYADASWVNTSTASATVGAYFKVGRTCYQLWATDFTGYLEARQELTNLPNGIYSVSMDLITNTDALSDQHIFAKSAIGETKGFMTVAGVLGDWPSGDYTGDYPYDYTEPWETVTTEGTVIVVDGKLTIGAHSTHGDPEVEDISSGYRRGSFWFTNVVLRYHGPATQDQIDAAVADHLQKANTLAASMHFAADKKQVNDSIAAYNSTNDFDVLNNGIALAEKSEAKYAEIMENGKTLPTIAANLADEALAAEAYGTCVDLVKYANDATLAWLASNKATYTLVDSCLNVLKGYSNTYNDAAKTATETISTFRSAKAKEAVNDIIAAHKAKMMPGANKLLATDVVNGLVEDLKVVLIKAQNMDTYERNPNGTNYTGWIINPDFAAITGWDVIQGTGNGPLNSGQYYTGDADHKYFDSYNSNKGELNIYAQQVIEGLPNGTYTARAAARTSAEGAFLFAANGEAKGDTIWMEIPMETYTYLNPVSEKDTTVNATDIYGSIWEEAFEQYISGSTDENVIAIATCNGQNGRGWKWVTIEGIVVEDHTLTIGQTTDGTRSGKAFEGTWFSVVDWSLTLTEKGDNEGWNPLTSVNDLKVDQPAANDGIYTLDGRRVSNASKGLYIVVRGGKASKVLVR